MNRKFTAIMIVLAVLTLVGLILVSNLVGAKRPERDQSSATNASAKPSPRPNLSISPLPSVSYRPSQAEGQMHTNLVRAQELLNNLGGAVAGNDWANAQNFFAEFERKTEHLPAPQLHYPDISPILQDFFDLYNVQLERALAEQNVQQANFAINQLYGIIGEQRVRLGMRGIPLEFQRLRFLAREIGVWSQTGDDKMLRVRMAALRDAWQDVRPLVVARRNGAQPAKDFDQLVQRLVSVGQVQELTALVPELNKELDQMDTLFHRPPRSAGAGSNSGKPADEEEE